jgi:DNA-binding LacI/PurR family transcriptional regulator
VFYQQPGSLGWNRFWQTLVNEAMTGQQTTQRELPCFFGVENHDDNESLRDLRREVNSDRVAGLILIGNRSMIGEAIWERTSLPKVGVWEPAPDQPPPSVYIDYQDFIDRSLDYVASRGRKRVAVIATPLSRFEAWAHASAKRDLFHPQHWNLSVDVRWPETVQPIVQLLMSLPKGERPNALVIADDNLVEHSLAGLLKSGVQVPDELELVVHCNWPQPVPSVLPMRRLGFDVRQILNTAIDLVDAQRRGDLVAAHTPVPAFFEEDVLKS